MLGAKHTPFKMNEGAPPFSAHLNQRHKHSSMKARFANSKTVLQLLAALNRQLLTSSLAFSSPLKKTEVFYRPHHLVLNSNTPRISDGLWELPVLWYLFGWSRMEVVPRDSPQIRVQTQPHTSSKSPYSQTAPQTRPCHLDVAWPPKAHCLRINCWTSAEPRAHIEKRPIWLSDRLTFTITVLSVCSCVSLNRRTKAPACRHHRRAVRLGRRTLTRAGRSPASPSVLSHGYRWLQPLVSNDVPGMTGAPRKTRVFVSCHNNHTRDGSVYSQTHCPHVATREKGLLMTEVRSSAAATGWSKFVCVGGVELSRLLVI